MVDQKTSPTWIIETRDLCRFYGDGDMVRALNHVNLKVAPGELVAVMGPSGSGKSTLLNVIGGLDLPTSGKIYIAGEDMASIRDMDHFRARTVGFIFQLHNLIPTLTARENVETPMMNHLTGSLRRIRAEELLTLVGLHEKMNRLPGQLSGGERQRIAVARALANNPPLVLADEPTGSLDTVNGQALMKLLREINSSQGTTFLVVTHDKSVALQTKRVLTMSDGKFILEDIIGTPLEEDIKMWRHSKLGQSILNGDKEYFDEAKLSTDQVKTIRKLLEEK
jgi:ABC-type lipoprotein export system ATPase subunit